MGDRQKIKLLSLCRMLGLLVVSFPLSLKGADKIPYIGARIPVASARYVLNLDRDRNETGGLASDAARRLEESLKRAGYTEQAWYLVAGTEGEDSNLSTILGAAVITRTEQFNADGSSHVGVGRFSRDYNPRVSSLSDYIRALLVQQPKGRFRTFLFAIMNTWSPMANVLPPSTQTALDNQFRGAARRTSDFAELKKFPFESNQIHSYVYEFFKGGDDRDFVFVPQSALDGRSHLEKAGILKQL